MKLVLSPKKQRDHPGRGQTGEGGGGQDRAPGQIQVNWTRGASGNLHWDGWLERWEAKRRECPEMGGVTGYVIAAVR